MLHIILFILKIIGLLLCVLLGLILVLALTVLLVPVRYQLNGSYDGTLIGRAKVTWLVHILSIRAEYDTKLELTIRLLGFRLFKPVEESREEADDLLVQAMEVTVDDAKDAAKEIGKDVEQSGREREEEDKAIVSEREIRTEHEAKGSVCQRADEKKPVAGDTAIRESDAEKEAKTAGAGHGRDENDSRKSSSAILSRIQKKITSLHSSLRHVFCTLCGRLKALRKKKDEIQAWLSDPDNQKTIKLLVRQFKKVLRHLMPTKGTASLTFGFGDPYLTGQALTYVSMVYPFVHQWLSITPMFEKQIVEGEARIRGRVRLGSLLWAAARMMFDKNFRRFLRRLLR